jgi:hypothetical protein
VQLDKLSAKKVLPVTITVKGFLSKCKSRMNQSSYYLIDPSRFLGVDAYWALCRTINVYLAFFRGYAVLELKLFDFIYLPICYVLSFTPAFIYIFLSNESRGKFYGPAIVKFIDSS